MAKLYKNHVCRLLYQPDNKGKIGGVCGAFAALMLLTAPVANAAGPGPATDSVKVAASKKYKAGLLRKFFIGKNYRDVWNTEVTMPVFRLSESGLKLTKLGGGQQTKSLQLVDGKGVEWVLRTVDKDVEKALPPKLQRGLAKGVVQDMISAAHPYAPLIVAHFAKALKVAAPDPQLYFVPDDPAFDTLRSVFANQVVFLEKRNPTIDDSDSKSTTKAQENLGEDNDRLVLQKQVLRARLLDMLIADWDRHADQWRWGTLDSANVKYYYAIPRDRDQAFFRATGLIPRIGKALGMKHINWFKGRTRGLTQLNFKSREFDPLFLNQLDAEQWRQVIFEFQQTLSDELVDEAVAKLPPPILEVTGDFLRKRLKNRVATMMNPVMGYYRELAAEVQVWGTKEPDLFRVSPEGDGIRVQVFALDKRGKQGLERYNRFFTRKETKNLHLEGLGGNDRFEIGKLGNGAPTLHIYGMDGNNVIVLEEENKRRIKIKTQLLGAGPEVLKAEEEEN